MGAQVVEMAQHPVGGAHRAGQLHQLYHFLVGEAAGVVDKALEHALHGGVAGVEQVEPQYLPQRGVDGRVVFKICLEGAAVEIEVKYGAALGELDAVGVEARAQQQRLHAQIVVGDVAGVVKDVDEVVLAVKALAHRPRQVGTEAAGKLFAGIYLVGGGHIAVMMGQAFFCSFSQLSRRPMVRLNTRASGVES